MDLEEEVMQRRAVRVREGLEVAFGAEEGRVGSGVMRPDRQVGPECGRSARWVYEKPR